MPSSPSLNLTIRPRDGGPLARDTVTVIPLSSKTGSKIEAGSVVDCMRPFQTVVSANGCLPVSNMSGVTERGFQTESTSLSWTSGMGVTDLLSSSDL